MLPFLKPKLQTGLTIINRKPDDSEEKDKEINELEECMKDLCQALESKDYRTAAEAFKDAVAECKDQPQDEEPDLHYDDLNELAAKEDR
jgi:hypothetical protein